MVDQAAWAALPETVELGAGCSRQWAGQLALGELGRRALGEQGRQRVKALLSDDTMMERTREAGGP